MISFAKAIAIATVVSIGSSVVGLPSSVRAAGPGDDDEGICSGMAPQCDRTTTRVCAEVEVSETTTYICHSKQDA